MGIYYDLIGTNGIVSANDRACFGSLKYIETDIGDYLSVKWFPFRCHDYDSNEVMYNPERFGGVDQEVIDAFWHHVLSKRFIRESLIDPPSVCEMRDGVVARADISARRMMVVLSILRAPQVLGDRAKCFFDLCERGHNHDLSFWAAMTIFNKTHRNENSDVGVNVVPCGEHDVFSPEHTTRDDLNKFLRIWEGDFKPSDLPRGVKFSTQMCYKRYRDGNRSAISRYFAKGDGLGWKSEENVANYCYEQVKGCTIHQMKESHSFRGTNSVYTQADQDKILNILQEMCDV